jgi:hypothetical protein
MASASTKSTAVAVVLELTEEEALYVFGALIRSRPKNLATMKDGFADPVFAALKDVLREAGIDDSRWSDFIEDTD